VAFDAEGHRAIATGPVNGVPVTTYFLYDTSGFPIVEQTYDSAANEWTLAYVNAMSADGWRAREQVGNSFVSYVYV
jgi:hypothetical protein